MIETLGGVIHPSPSELTEAGRAILAQDPHSPGSLGIAISEAVEVAAQSSDANYALGSVLNHVMLHQTIIGEQRTLGFGGGIGRLVVWLRASGSVGRGSCGGLIHRGAVVGVEGPGQVPCRCRHCDKADPRPGRVRMHSVGRLTLSRSTRP